MSNPWHKKVAKVFREGFGHVTSKFRKGQEFKDVNVGAFRMMFASDLYPETNSMKDSTDSNSGEEEDDDDGRKGKKKKISEAGRRTEQFLLAAAKLIINHVISTFEPNQKITDPDWLEGDRELGQCMESILQLSDEAQSLEEMLMDLKELLKNSMNAGNPRVMNNPSSGIDVISLAGEWLTATANTNMFTYEIAPVFILIEDIILTKMRFLIGWPEASGDGIFAPGGAISNMYALGVARHKLNPDHKSKGMFHSKQLTIFVTSQCSTSVIRSAVVLGFGLRNVVFVECNDRGQMLSSDLDAKVKRSKSEGAEPFFVSANSGSAMLGSFDCLTEIADVCERYNLWLHVDASHGGNVLLSKDHCHLVRGIRRAHSVTWNCHSMMGVMLQCSAILIREKGLLEACNSACASYLFQQDKHYDVAYDTGDKAIQCGRHNDVFKLWVVWRARGNEGMTMHVDRLFQLARQFTELLLNTEGFQLVLPEFEFVTICFWYVPEVMRTKDCNDVMNKLSELTEKITKRINNEGLLLIGCFNPSLQKAGKSNEQTIKEIRKLKMADLTLINIHDLELPSFFKVTLNNPSINAGDFSLLLSEIRRIGDGLVLEIMANSMTYI